MPERSRRWRRRYRNLISFRSASGLGRQRWKRRTGRRLSKALTALNLLSNLRHQLYPLNPLYLVCLLHTIATHYTTIHETYFLATAVKKRVGIIPQRTVARGSTPTVYPLYLLRPSYLPTLGTVCLPPIPRPSLRTVPTPIHQPYLTVHTIPAIRYPWARYVSFSSTIPTLVYSPHPVTHLLSALPTVRTTPTHGTHDTYTILTPYLRY